MASHTGAAASGHQKLLQRWDQTNTVLVDDSAEKGRSEPHNILQIPEFSGLQNEPANVLPQVHDYLNQLSYQVDIARYMRQNPFKLNPDYTLAGPPGSSGSTPSLYNVTTHSLVVYTGAIWRLAIKLTVRESDKQI